MKVKLTPRTQVNATGPHYTVDVNETIVTIRTDFGAVVVHRNRAGLQVNLHVKHQGEQFFEVRTKPGTVERYTKLATLTAELRDVGAVTMGECQKDGELEGIVRQYITPAKGNK